MLFVTPVSIIAFILKWFGLKKPMAFISYKAAQLWGIVIRLLTGCKIEVSGRENIPKKGGVCFVSNHGSIFDIIIALIYIGRPFGFIAKKELILIPLLNIWISILGGLFIDRKNLRKGLKTINEGVRRLKKGGAILIFPEGHRSRGQGVLPFHPGSLKLATESGVPIVPISIKGSWDVFEKEMRVKAVNVGIRFGNPVLKPELKKHALAEEIRSIIIKGFDDLSC